MLDQIKSENAFRTLINESATLDLHYTNQEINTLLDKAIEKHLSIEDGMGIIFQGCRLRRDGIIIPFSTLLDRVDKLKVVRGRHFPYTFTSKMDFEDYANSRILGAVQRFGLKQDRVYYGGSSIVSTSSVGDGFFDTDWSVEYSQIEMAEYSEMMARRWKECISVLEDGAIINYNGRVLKKSEMATKIKDSRSHFQKKMAMHKRYIVYLEYTGTNNQGVKVYELITLDNYLKAFPNTIKTDLTPVTIGFNEAYPKIKYTF